MADYIQGGADETRIRTEMLRRLMPVLRRDIQDLAGRMEQRDDALEILTDYDIRRKAAPGIDLDVDE